MTKVLLNTVRCSGTFREKNVFTEILIICEYQSLAWTTVVKPLILNSIFFCIWHCVMAVIFKGVAVFSLLIYFYLRQKPILIHIFGLSCLIFKHLFTFSLNLKTNNLIQCKHFCIHAVWTYSIFKRIGCTLCSDHFIST